MKSIVGIFDGVNAERAIEALRRLNYEPEVITRDAFADNTGTGAPLVPAAAALPGIMNTDNNMNTGAVGVLAFNAAHYTDRIGALWADAPDAERRSYGEALERGNTLVRVQVNDNHTDSVIRIMRDYHATNYVDAK
jgi:hypothetical protein